MKILQQLGGKDFLGVVAFGEEGADVGEQLDGSGEIITSVDVKDSVQGQARLSGPFAAEHLGDGKQGQGTLALAHRKPGKKICVEEFVSVAE